MKARVRAVTVVTGAAALLAITIPASASVRAPLSCNINSGNTIVIEECSNFSVAVTDIYSSNITAHFEIWNRQNTSEWRNGPEENMYRDYQQGLGSGWNETCAELWQRVDGTTVRLGEIECTTP